GGTCGELTRRTPLAASGIPVVPVPCDGAHAEGHAFPTRRSSDLAGGPSADAGWRAATAGRGRDRHAAVPVPPRLGRRRPRPAVRSEEHTSELQSREKLGCRRLLEKEMEERGPAPRVSGGSNGPVG